MTAGAALVVALALLLVACGADAAPTPPSPSGDVPSPTEVPPDAAALGTVEPAPGSDSAVYAPNPSAIVVAIDAGHGGCLDWGVPDPSARGPEMAEKTLTLEIARRLRDRLEAEGASVVMIRDADVALAGDLYPPLGCDGAPFRDVNGDGLAGFGPEFPEATRTRDELQARLDLANLAQADALVSIHINSPSDGGQHVEIAFSETFYTDETPWGAVATARLAEQVQSGVVDKLGSIASYDRGDRGVTAHNFYLVAPPLIEPTAERPNRFAQPTRGGLMPVVLAEVGSITLRAEHDLLATAYGQEAVATGLFEGLAAFFADRGLAGRIAPVEAVPGTAPIAVDGDGPPFWAPTIPDDPLRLRLTNSGTSAWPAGMELLAGWQETDQPYLAEPPDGLAPLPIEVPSLAPGESVVVEVTLPSPPATRALAWISLSNGVETLADQGSPALQLSSGAP